MDETLTKQRIALLEYHNLVSSYEKVCAKLVKKWCDNCPDFRQFQELYVYVNMKSSDLYELEKATKDFQPTLDKINTVEGDLACYKQVKDLMGEAEPIKRSLANQFKSTKCKP